MATTTLGDKQCIDPATLLTQIQEANQEGYGSTIPEDFIKRANSYTNPLGPCPGRGWCLMYRNDVVGLLNKQNNASNGANYPWAGSFVIDDKKVLDGAWIVKAICVTPGIINTNPKSGSLNQDKFSFPEKQYPQDPSSVYLVEFSDIRLLMSKFFFDNQNYNIRVRNPATNSYDGTDKDEFNAGSLKTIDGITYTIWTWQQILDNIWGTYFTAELGLSTPSLPYTPHGVPENFRVICENRFLAYNKMLARLDCALSYNSINNSFSIVKLSSSQSNLASNQTNYVGSLLMDYDTLEVLGDKVSPMLQPAWNIIKDCYGSEIDFNRVKAGSTATAYEGVSDDIIQEITLAGNYGGVWLKNTVSPLTVVDTGGTPGYTGTGGAVASGFGYLDYGSFLGMTSTPLLFPNMQSGFTAGGPNGGRADNFGVVMWDESVLMFTDLGGTNITVNKTYIANRHNDRVYNHGLATVFSNRTTRQAYRGIIPDFLTGSMTKAVVFRDYGVGGSITEIICCPGLLRDPLTGPPNIRSVDPWPREQWLDTNELFQPPDLSRHTFPGNYPRSYQFVEVGTYAVDAVTSPSGYIESGCGVVSGWLLTSTTDPRNDPAGTGSTPLALNRVCKIAIVTPIGTRLQIKDVLNGIACGRTFIQGAVLPAFFPAVSKYAGGGTQAFVTSVTGAGVSSTTSSLTIAAFTGITGP